MVPVPVASSLGTLPGLTMLMSELNKSDGATTQNEEKSTQADVRHGLGTLHIAEHFNGTNPQVRSASKGEHAPNEAVAYVGVRGDERADDAGDTA